MFLYENICVMRRAFPLQYPNIIYLTAEKRVGFIGNVSKSKCSYTLRISKCQQSCTFRYFWTICFTTTVKNDTFYQKFRNIWINTGYLANIVCSKKIYIVQFTFFDQGWNSYKFEKERVLFFSTQITLSIMSLERYTNKIQSIPSD